MWNKTPAFWLRSHRNIGRCSLPELPLWQRYHAKNHSVFLQKFLWITPNITELFSGCQILDCFQLRSHRIYADVHCQNCLSDKDIMLKTTQPFFKSYCELHLMLWSFFLDVRFWLLEIRTNTHCQNCLIKSACWSNTCLLCCHFKLYYYASSVTFYYAVTIKSIGLTVFG